MLRRLAVLALVGATLFIAGPAAADPPSTDAGGRGQSPPDQPVDAVSDAGSVEVTVSSSGSTSSGRTFTSQTVRRVAPLCWYGRGKTGLEYYEFWKPGGPGHQSQTMDAYSSQVPVHPDFESHATDSDGHWYEATCSVTAPADVALAYYLAHPGVWVPPGTPGPAATATVDPAVLAQIASQAMDLPTGTIEWNPKLTGDGAAVVGQDTWVWVADAPTSVQVTASIPGLSATVTAHVSTMNLSAPGADPTTCPDTGTPWTAGATGSTCTITFFRSSANQKSNGQSPPTSTLSAKAVWSASWVSTLNPTPTPLLPDQTVTTTAQVPVAEIQAITTRG